MLNEVKEVNTANTQRTGRREVGSFLLAQFSLWSAGPFIQLGKNSNVSYRGFNQNVELAEMVRILGDCRGSPHGKSWTHQTNGLPGSKSQIDTPPEGLLGRCAEMWFGSGPDMRPV